MSFVVICDGQEYDVDPVTAFSQRELGLMEQHSGMSWREVTSGALTLDPTALRALFWTVDQRREPGLKFSTYEGPTLNDWLPYLGGWKSDVVDPLAALLRKAMPDTDPADAEAAVATPAELAG